jgi:transcriptional regulator with XRE-family HTH domain
MLNRLTSEQIAQIVAEVERLPQGQQNEPDVAQLEQVLHKLNLPPDLLDEAFTQLYRRQVKAKTQKRNRLIIIGVAVVFLGAIAASVLVLQKNQKPANNQTSQLK